MTNSKTKVKLAFSPCPNDTYIFGGIALNLINSSISYDITLADIAELNALGREQEFDVIKMSYRAWASMIDQYQMLPIGSALGYGVGPLLIANTVLSIEEIRRVAIPGKLTTANFLLDYAYKHHAFEKVEMIFSDIEAAIDEGRVDAGVIIHESRFTYRDRGFCCIQDLGQYWEASTNLPIPLGGIAVRRDLSHAVKQQVVSDIQASIQFADMDIRSIGEYIVDHAQEMDLKVMQEHINLYVNESTRGLSSKDVTSINYMIKEIGSISKNSQKFCNEWLFRTQ